MRKIVKVDAPMQELVKSVLSTLNIDDQGKWPVSAEFHVNYRLKCWPMGFDNGHDVYFDTREELDAWFEEKEDWAALEDNKLHWSLERWDLGPVYVGCGEIG